MVGRGKQGAAESPALTVHQIVAYNFRRAREETGWTQSQTSDLLEPFLGYRLNQAGVSAIEKTFDSERRRNIDVAEVVAFSRCFQRPIGWFFLPPPGMGAGRVEPTTDRQHELRAADLAALTVGSSIGWDAFLGRITELLSTDKDTVWRALHAAFSGVTEPSWENQINLRRRAVQQVTLARFASHEDDVITGMAALLVELVKSTPLGFLKLRETDPQEALRVLAEGDRLVQPLIEDAEKSRAEGVPSNGGFDDLTGLDLLAALGIPDSEE